MYYFVHSEWFSVMAGAERARDLVACVKNAMLDTTTVINVQGNDMMFHRL